MNGDRERAVTAAFVALARSLADGVDPVDLLVGLAQDATGLLGGCRCTPGPQRAIALSA